MSVPVRGVFIALLLVSLGGCKALMVKPDQPEITSRADLYEGRLTAEMLGVEEALTAEDATIRADEAWRRGEQDRAAAYYIRAMELATVERDALQDNSADENAVDREALLTAREKITDAGFRLGKLYQSRGNLVLAEKVYGVVLGEQPNHIAALEAVGLIQLEKRQLAMARELLKQAVAEWRDAQGQLTDTPYQPVLAFNGLGVLADLDDDYRQAADYYREALSLSPGTKMLMNNLGYSLYLNGEWDEARKWFGEALNRDPDYHKALQNLALVSVRQQEFDEAVELLEQMMEPWEARNDIGYLAMVAGFNKTAENLFQDAIDTAPVYYSDAWNNLNKLRKRKL